MLSANPRVLVLTLYCGEHEYAQCSESVVNQDYEFVDHVVISDKPNKEAHDLLYNTIMQSVKKYSFFIKLDADMIMEDRSFISKVVDRFSRDESLDVLSYTVYDYFTKSRIWGINCYSSRCRWTLSEESLFVDHQPLYPGAKITMVDFNNMISHCANPSSYQAFMFGFHRALKVIQKDRKYVLPGHSLVQAKTIQKMQSANNSSYLEARAYALRGVFAVYSGSYKLCDRKDDYVEVYAGSLDKYPIGASLPAVTSYTHVKAIGFFRLVVSVILHLYKKVK